MINYYLQGPKICSWQLLIVTCIKLNGWLINI